MKISELTVDQNSNKKNSTFLTNRDKRIYFFYKIYLFSWDKSESSRELNERYFEYDFSNKEEEAILKLIDNFDDIEIRYKNLLPSDWKIERLDNLDKAILLNGVFEMTLFSNKKEIVIDESVKYAKKYCSSKSYSLINGILDKIKAT